MVTHAQADDFEAAKAIFEQLKDFPLDRQERILRWVAEGLGLSAVVTTKSPVIPQAEGVRPVTPVGPAQPPSPSGGVDIKTFVTAKAPKSDTQFAAAVAYYYRFEAPPAQRLDSINAEVLQEATRLAGRPRLAKPNATLNNAKAAGYLDGVSPGEFAINTVGENLVAMTLPGSGSATPPGPKSRRAKKTSSGKATKKKTRA